MSSPEERLEILRAETEGLEEYLKDLPKGAWDQPSACDQWCIADVVAHLAGAGRDYPSRISRGLEGDTSPDMAPIPHIGSGQLDPSSIAEGAIARRVDFGEDLLTEFIKSNQSMDEALAKVGPEDWDRPVYRTVGIEPVRNILDMLITERTVHGWDIRSRFDSQASLSPECVPIIVERIAQRPRWWSFKEGLAPLPLRYRIEVTSPTHYSVDLVVTEGNQFMEVASSRDAQVTFQTDGETYIMLMYGRIEPEAAIANGRMSCEGDQELVTAFVQRFTGG